MILANNNCNKKLVKNLEDIQIITIFTADSYSCGGGSALHEYCEILTIKIKTNEGLREKRLSEYYDRRMCNVVCFGGNPSNIG